jgi:hypothetical protein
MAIMGCASQILAMEFGVSIMECKSLIGETCNFLEGTIAILSSKLCLHHCSENA